MTDPRDAAQRPDMPEVVTGVHLMQGIGHAPAKGFWVDAWSQVIRRPGAIFALSWLGIVAFFAAFGPLIASGHPLIFQRLGADGSVASTSFPLFRFLTALDIALVLAVVAGAGWVLLGGRERRGGRFGQAIGLLLASIGLVVITSIAQSSSGGRDLSATGQWLRSAALARWVVSFAAVAIVSGLVLAFPGERRARRLGWLIPACLIGIAASVLAWDRPAVDQFEKNYRIPEMTGTARATYTLVPFSPAQMESSLRRRPPGMTLGEGLGLATEDPAARRTFWMGTDANGADVLSQMISACRLSISIGFVSTGIALLIGVTLGALMGYFGGVVDLLLYRVVEVFMAVPVLFLLIVVTAVLPPELRSTYVMMAIIGCFSWTGMARFTRAEFLKLRNQDFVQAARAVGLPLRTVLFRHMLPNGVAPVLVDASFAIAAAITIEAVLSFLGYGPLDSASWGKILAGARSTEGEFKVWLAVFPGLAIFLTVLSYNLLGEALRDAIDPKLKKARV